MMRVGAMILSATLAVLSVLAYVLLGNRQFHNEPASAWGAIRVGCLLIDFVSVITLAALLLLYRNELTNMPTVRVMVIGVFVVNGLFLVVFVVGLLLFLFPPG